MTRSTQAAGGRASARSGSTAISVVSVPVFARHRGAHRAGCASCRAPSRARGASASVDPGCRASPPGAPRAARGRRRERRRWPSPPCRRDYANPRHLPGPRTAPLANPIVEVHDCRGLSSSRQEPAPPGRSARRSACTLACLRRREARERVGRDDRLSRLGSALRRSSARGRAVRPRDRGAPGCALPATSRPSGARSSKRPRSPRLRSRG